MYYCCPTDRRSAAANSAAEDRRATQVERQNATKPQLERAVGRQLQRLVGRHLAIGGALRALDPEALGRAAVPPLEALGMFNVQTTDLTLIRTLRPTPSDDSIRT